MEVERSIPTCEGTARRSSRRNKRAGPRAWDRSAPAAAAVAARKEGAGAAGEGAGPGPGRSQGRGPSARRTRRAAFSPQGGDPAKIERCPLFPALGVFLGSIRRREGALDPLDAQALSAACSVQVHLPVHPPVLWLLQEAVLGPWLLVTHSVFIECLPCVPSSNRHNPLTPVLMEFAIWGGGHRDDECLLSGGRLPMGAQTSALEVGLCRKRPPRGSDD